MYFKGYDVGEVKITEKDFLEKEKIIIMIDSGAENKFYDFI